jgi:hypothetical protein
MRMALDRIYVDRRRAVQRRLDRDARDEAPRSAGLLARLPRLAPDGHGRRAQPGRAPRPFVDHQANDRRRLHRRIAIPRELVLRPAHALRRFDGLRRGKDRHAQLPDERRADPVDGDLPRDEVPHRRDDAAHVHRGIARGVVRLGQRIRVADVQGQVLPRPSRRGGLAVRLRRAVPCRPSRTSGTEPGTPRGTPPASRTAVRGRCFRSHRGRGRPGRAGPRRPRRALHTDRSRCIGARPPVPRRRRAPALHDQATTGPRRYEDEHPARGVA